ncbi:MAG: TorF family putative porin [Sphingopyxis sp.]|uniref:TorF family putative porin n=1 Tax=Sphingopyxis sp. TaxID=1908224 RepID=UPI002ABB740C|nr:TorF family putative porin [Sphingopyxis sp.]MDZ3833753.1 TorF family putative porin [Sphingopyxis sp.]
MTFLNRTGLGFLAAVAAASSAPAFAQDVPSGPISVTGGVELVSDYRFRGVSLSGGDVAVQPTITVSHDSGFYLGAWGSNLEDTPTYGEIEVDLYGGYATEIAPGTSIDVGLTYYWYPDGKKAAGPADYFEVIGKLSHTLGPVEATGTVGYSWDQSSLGDDDNLYLGLGLSAGIPNTPVTLSASAGYTDGALGALAPGGNYWDWSIGASASFGPVTAGVKYVDTDIPTTGVKAVDKYYDSGVIFSLGVFF